MQDLVLIVSRPNQLPVSCTGKEGLVTFVMFSCFHVLCRNSCRAISTADSDMTSHNSLFSRMHSYVYYSLLKLLLPWRVLEDSRTSNTDQDKQAEP